MRGVRDTWNGDDRVLARAGGGPQSFLGIQEEADGFIAAMNLGVGG